VLAIPFIAVLLATAGLSRPFDVYQAGDEIAHFSIVLSFAQDWPEPLLTGYESWSGPLVYWLLATLARPFGTSIVSVRLVVVVLSWLTSVVVYVIYRDRLRARPPVALALALMLVLSPFFFGESFCVLTDNPAWLFVAVALERLLAYVGEPRKLRLAGFAFAVAAATLMRQITSWLFIPALFAVAGARATARDRWWGAVIVALGAAPVIALLLAWGGLLPSGAVQDDPAVHRLRNVCFSLTVVGLWSLLLIPAEDVRSLGARLHRRGVVAVAAATVLGVAVVAAGVMDSMSGGKDPYGVGLVGKLGETWPIVAGTSLAWWVFVPVGAAALAGLVVLRWSALRDRIVVVALGAVVLSAAVNTMWYQRYADVAVFLLLGCLVASGRAPVRWLDVLRWAGIVAVSLIWTAAVAWG
jgi:4-amino-4-deoxy-L-arabinose transferase-like glycosyltransferase